MATEQSSEVGATWLQGRLNPPRYRPHVFLSYPTPVSASQYQMVTRLYDLLKRVGVAPRTLGVREYDYEQPMGGVRQIMRQSHGFLGVGFSKTVIVEGSTVTRRGRDAPVVEALADVHLTSPWVHIETAMAHQAGIPIALLIEKGVFRDGVLEPGALLYRPYQFDLGASLDDVFKQEDLQDLLDKWAARVKEYARGGTY